MTEAELIKKCKMQDRMAQRQLYEQYGPRLMHLCLRYMQQVEDAEEVFHDALMKVYTKIDTFKFNSSLGTWIYRIGMYTALDKLRTNKKLLKLSYLAELPDEEADDADWQTVPQEEMVMNWISKLSPNKQVVMNMHVFENMKHEEIADVLGVSHSAVRSIYSRAKREIVELYNQEVIRHECAK